MASRLKISERIRITHLAADRLRRDAISSVLYSPPFRWQFGASAAEQLLIVPQDLRTADPSFWDEVEVGQFGLAGAVALADDVSPFDIIPPSEAWTRALHGFAWLRHLAAVGRPEAREMAQLLAAEWAMRHRGGSGIAWEPHVTGRRLISWISHSGFLLEEADAETYEILTESLGIQLVRLAAGWRSSPSGYPRLLSLLALLLAQLCISGHEGQVSETEKLFVQELDRQILHDGGHVGRNPGILVELILDLLPLSQCFAARSRTAPPEFAAMLKAMLGMLKYMRLGDGMLARFNGMGVASPAGLATVLVYDDNPGAIPASAPASKYIRLERGASILIMDAGPPPPLESAAAAHAGCLSFELSVGTSLMLVNGGAPSSANADWRAASRATASHNTLCLGEKSSSKLIRHKMLEGLVGGMPIRFPDEVKAKVEAQDGAIELTAEHDGYMRRFGLMHRRTLALAASGRRLLGIDRLAGKHGTVRLRQDVPFAVHFHLHPAVRCRRGDNPSIAIIELPGGDTWWFSLEGARLAIEESTYFADSAGPRRSLQIVARGATFGETEVRWVLEGQD
ncbi:heparinase II/III family protein [Hyphomicrobium sp.]|uniref:heparinase II/III family protein n=1 Tax=Hyphomicrobium sp. TaxID=82 RepID=UPI0025BFE5BC|nr:heparinase II/III family protein [Hyphomicrobium sp.]MCC7252761.1 heparinase II/III family protein [Hyphomicrobium sp.]